mmetsp:Transcript_37546/g.108182  ORF Transcript_37546/g.108182 Transcript_37546/m.108182 type:complete len:204 (+) Transcript_37546:96-707(+)
MLERTQCRHCSSRLAGSTLPLTRADAERGALHPRPGGARPRTEGNCRLRVQPGAGAGGAPRPPAGGASPGLSRPAFNSAFHYEVPNPDEASDMARTALKTRLLNNAVKASPPCPGSGRCQHSIDSRAEVITTMPSDGVETNRNFSTFDFKAGIISVPASVSMRFLRPTVIPARLTPWQASRLFRPVIPAHTQRRSSGRIWDQQ